MKNLHNIQEMKQFSIALQKFLKEKDIEIKHSLMLEGFAKAMDLPDWNTLSAVLQKQALSQSIDYTKFSKDSEKIIRSGNQTYYFQFDNELKVMLVGSENEYSSFSLFVQVTNLDIFTQLSNKLIDYINFHTQSPTIINSNFVVASPDGSKIIDSKNNPQSKSNTIKIENNYSFECDNGKILFDTVNHTLIFENEIHQLVIAGLNKMNFTKQLLQFFNDNSQVKMNMPRFVYPLNDSLLSNMAMRYDHSFGLWAQEGDEKTEKFLEKMRKLHSLYSQNLSDEEIIKLSGIDSISVKQLREEVEGDGFYNPNTNDDLRKYPHKMFQRKK